eukprot:CAMPEP_0174876182 /NCGR_PEP_ID=MMETSP1114-20130205/79667_1 /TAXON_ID=312471 /ORGANISM="Neobodo designis, Strain CCAP 1951/1" /LENGTH=100 /DNA_ID=CAMNT_0016111543 /DNA_START=1 /DNA_END=300 /DNA_ORIENTATION=-
MPNRAVDEPLRGLFACVSAMIASWKLDITDVINNPTREKVWRLVSEITRGLNTRYDRNFMEAGLQALLEYALRELTDRFGFTVDCESEYSGGERRADLRL